MGRRRVRSGAARGPAGVPVGGLRHLPLVPRDGARVVRGRGGGGVPERELRLHQARPRGAPRRRPHLHGGGAGDQRLGRLADDGVPDARPAPRVRRYLLPAARRLRPARLPGRAAPAGADVARAALRAGAGGRLGGGQHPRLPGGRTAGVGPGRGRPGGGSGRCGGRLRRPGGRLRAGAQVPAAVGGVAAAAPPRRGRRGGPAAPRHGAAHAGRHGGRRHVRSPGRRLPPLFRGPPLARTALREDALRPGAAHARLRRGVPGDRRRALRRDRPPHRRLPAARPDHRRRRVLLRGGRRQRGLDRRSGAQPRRRLLPVGLRRGARRARRGAIGRSVHLRLRSGASRQHAERPARRAGHGQRALSLGETRCARGSAPAPPGGGSGALPAGALRAARAPAAAAARRQGDRRLERAGDRRAVAAGSCRRPRGLRAGRRAGGRLGAGCHVGRPARYGRPGR